MPVSILTFLILGSSWLPIGAGDELPGKRQPGVTLAVSCWSVERPAILPRSTDQQDLWAISEANSDEEESGDGDPDGVVTEHSWLDLWAISAGRSSATRLDFAVFQSSIRSPILRC